MGRTLDIMIVTLHEAKLYDIGVQDAPVNDGYPECDGGEAGLHAPGHGVQEGEGGGGEIMRRHPPANNNASVDQIMEGQKTNTWNRIYETK